MTTVTCGEQWVNRNEIFLSIVGMYLCTKNSRFIEKVILKWEPEVLFVPRNLDDKVCSGKSQVKLFTVFNKMFASQRAWVNKERYCYHGLNTRENIVCLIYFHRSHEPTVWECSRLSLEGQSLITE